MAPSRSSSTSSSSSFNKLVVTNAEWLLRTVLLVLEIPIDIVWWLSNDFLTGLVSSSSSSSTSSSSSEHNTNVEDTTTTTTTTTTTVVIVGGSFAGLAALWKLRAAQNKTTKKFRIILIDQKNYFEYTPGVLRLFCEPDLFSNISGPLLGSKKLSSNDNNNNNNNKDDYEFIQGRVVSVYANKENDDGTNNNNNNNKKLLSYVPTTKSASVMTSSSTGTTPTSTPKATSTPKRTSLVRQLSASAQRQKTLAYDYLILATGATYDGTIPFTSASNLEYSLTERNEAWKSAHTSVQQAKRILILGGGAVGVELAAEIAHYYGSTKQVTLVDASPTLVPLFPKAVSEYATKWMQQQPGVTLRLGEPLASWNETSCTFQKDASVLRADLVFVCFGAKSNSQCCTIAATNLLFSLDRRNAIRVKDTLQVTMTPTMSLTSTAGSNNNGTSMEESVASSIFVCGDVAAPARSAEKQALQAECQGCVAAHNILSLMKQEETMASARPLWKYPTDLGAPKGMPLIFVLSLGPHDGVLAFNWLCVPGPLAAIVKWILEYTKVAHMAGRPMGKVIWAIGDAVVLFLNRTLIQPTTMDQGATASAATAAAARGVGSGTIISSTPTVTSSTPVNKNRMALAAKIR